MTRIFKSIAAILVVAALFGYSARTYGAEPKQFTMKYQGLEREYLLYIPEGMPENAPLVLVLHGYGGRAMNGGSAMCKVADREKFAVCYPQGAKDGKGKTCWNVGYPFQERLKTDDVNFLCKLARHLQKEYNLSKQNTFLTGMSNGGEMCYLMAYMKPDFFGAIAPIAGLTLDWMQKELTAKGSVPMMEVHGTADKTSLWNGDPMNEGGWGAYIAVPIAVGKWVDEARCSYEVTDTLAMKTLDKPAEDPRKQPKQVILHKYLGGIPAWKEGPETEVWLYEVIGGDHSWSEHSLDTCEEIWRFFSKWLR